MISSKYSIDDCATMLSIMGVAKLPIPLYAEIASKINSEYGGKTSLTFIASGKSLSARTEEHCTISYKQIEINEFWQKKISIVSSFDYARFIKDFCKKRKMKNIGMLVNKFHKFSPLPASAISV